MRFMSLAVMACATAAPAPAAAQPLSRTDISRGVRAVRPAIDGCLRQARATGTVVVRFDIADGRAANVQVSDRRSAACVSAVVQKARFRRAAQRITVSYPFVAPGFKAGRAPLPPPGASLSREQISLGIASIRDAVDLCRRSRSKIRVKVRIEIANGRVASARGTSASADPRTIACVERAVAQASFPRAAPITVNYPFVLH